MYLITKNYNGLPIEFTVENNELYINATKTARYFGKEAKHWKYTKFPVNYFKAYNKFLNEYSTTFNTDNILNSEQFIVSIHGGKAVKQGTWIHKKLIFPFTSWLDMDFAIWCEYTVEKLLNNIHNNKTTNTTKEINTNPSVKSNNELNVFKEECKKEIDIVKQQISKIKDDIKSLSNDTDNKINNTTTNIVNSDSNSCAYSASYLLKKFNVNLTPRDFYTLLEHKGLFETYEYFNNTKKKNQRLRKFKENYNDYGYNKPLSKKTELPYYIMFYENKFEELLDIVKS